MSNIINLKDREEVQRREFENETISRLVNHPDADVKKTWEKLAKEALRKYFLPKIELGISLPRELSSCEMKRIHQMNEKNLEDYTVKIKQMNHSMIVDIISLQRYIAETIVFGIKDNKGGI